MASKLKYNEDAAALTWEILNGEKNIGNWELLYKNELIKGKGFKDFISAATKLSANVNVIYVRYLNYFITVSQNFIDYTNKQFFANSSMNFYYIFCADNVELRNWDNFWDKVQDKTVFMERLDICRTVFTGENKNKLSLSTHFRYTLSRQMWEDMKYRYYLRTPEVRGYCKQMLPKDRDEFDYMNFIYKGSFFYSNPEYYRKNTVKVNYYDISSSHIGFMARKNYPYESFQEETETEKIQKIISDKFYCWYGMFYFERLQYKKEFPLDLKKFGVPVENDMCSWFIYLTNVDIEWFKQVFEWKSCAAVKFYYTRQKPLGKVDKNFVSMVDSLYRIKDAQKKGTFAKEIHKFRAELPFGQSIKNEDYYGKIIYNDNEFEYVDTDGTDFEQIKYKLSERGVPMCIGVWTAAYSRLEFFTMVNKIGLDKVIYGDTDSVFFIGDEGIEAVKEHNKEIDKEFEAIEKIKKVNFNKKMGRWCDQGRLDCMKPIATKWYLMLHSDGEFEVKASGVDTEKLLAYLKSQNTPFAAFDLNKIKVDGLRREYRQNYADKTITCKFCKKIDKNFRKELFEQTTTLFYFNPYEKEED